ncbi:transglutaminase domain-containing protein [Candidatus Dojkabacteria bacterium]|nr:transglutaminase domain-containing protein [Candidatus Dojkabacteria bacterium]
MAAESVYDVNINVSGEGEMEFEYFIHLINKSDGFFIRDYSLIIDQKEVIDLKVMENGQGVDFRKEHFNGNIRVKIHLNKQLVYKEESTDIYVRYKTRDLYKKDGLVSKIYIPQIKTEESLQDANFTVTIPDSLGEISYVSMQEISLESQGEQKVMKYPQKEAPQGLLLMFGQVQQFEFIYSYKLQNNKGAMRRYTITLPPDSSFQTSYFIDASILPERTFSDKDGNIIVEYLLNSGEEKDVRIVGFTRFTPLSETQTIEDEVLDKYLTETGTWDFSKQSIDELLNKITRSDYLPKENARFIYDYLVTNYKYLPEDGSRKKVSDLIVNDDGLTCENFSDVFVALSRGAGIPSRSVVGFSMLKENLSSLHYWAEFYDSRSKRWIGVDPCFAAKLNYSYFDTLDANRVVLAYRGLSDSSPEVIVPFSDFQGLNGDQLEITASSYNYLGKDNWVDFSFVVGKPDLFFQQIPLTLKLRNNSMNILRIDEILVDHDQVKLVTRHTEDDFQEAVFPDQETDFLVYLSNLSGIPVERIENHELEVLADYGGLKFDEKREFEINRPFTYLHALSWFMALAMACITLAVFFLALKKIRDSNIPYGDKVKSLKQRLGLKKFKIKKYKNVPVDLR